LTLPFLEFFLGTVVSLATSWVLVTRLERVGERIGLSEALLGVLAALAADAPEITSSVTALSHHQRSIGAGVVIGSNVFNLAALLGLGALVSGFIALHRKVVVLGGVVAMLVASSCIATITGVFSVGTGLVIAGLVFGTYVIVLGAKGQSLRRLAIPVKWHVWISVAIEEEELELSEAIRPPRGRTSDFMVAAGALVTVVVASATMERSASTLGHHFHVADAVIGAIVLAGVTSLPNAVAAIHLASKGRGAAALSTALNSNSINVIAGLLIPGLFVGLARSSVPGSVTAWWYVGLTLVTLVFAFLSRGLRRWQGGVLVLGYLAFVVVLVSAT
jgi:cation:H+ antiporter